MDEGSAAIVSEIWRVGAATLVLVLFLWALARLYPRLYGAIEALQQRPTGGLRVQRLELLSAARLAALLVRLARVSRVALTVLALYLYVPLSLSLFPSTAPYADPVVEWAVAPFVTAWKGFVAYLPSLFWLVAIAILARWALRLVRLVFRAIGDGTIQFAGFYPEWAEPTGKLVQALLLAFAAVVAFPYLPGSSSQAFKGVSIFLGVLVSLGSSSAVAHVVAGVVLTYTRAFRVGDFIRLGAHTGTVVERTLLVTRLRTPKRVEVTIPNAAVLAADVQNYSRHAGPGVVLHTEVTIGYDTPWRTVHELLLGAAGRTPDVAVNPPPFVLQTALQDCSVRYELNVYTQVPERGAGILSRLHAEIQDTFARAGLEILSPAYHAHRDGPSTVPPPPPDDAPPS